MVNQLVVNAKKNYIFPISESSIISHSTGDSNSDIFFIAEVFKIKSEM